MDIDPFKRVSKKTYENEDYKKKKQEISYSQNSHKKSVSQLISKTKERSRRWK